MSELKFNRVNNEETWTYNGRPIQSVPCYKYLGLYFKPNLSWSFAHEYASKQASKAIAAIFRFRFRFRIQNGKY